MSKAFQSDWNAVKFRGLRPTLHATTDSGSNSGHWGWSWLALCAALAVHVADEALTDFLSVYNPIARAIRERVPFLPLPVFTFGPDAA